MPGLQIFGGGRGCWVKAARPVVRLFIIFPLAPSHQQPPGGEPPSMHCAGAVHCCVMVYLSLGVDCAGGGGNKEARTGRPRRCCGSSAGAAACAARAGPRSRPGQAPAASACRAASRPRARAAARWCRPLSAAPSARSPGCRSATPLLAPPSLCCSCAARKPGPSPHASCTLNAKHELNHAPPGAREPHQPSGGHQT